MNCQELNDFIENSVPVERTSASFAEAQRHASTCPACAAVLAGMLRLEAELMSLSGIEADKRLTQSVMRRIDSLSMNPAVGRPHRDLLGILSMVTGALILAAVYWWTLEWSEVRVRALPLSLIGNWAVNSARLGEFRIDILLPTLIGAALIAIGLVSEGDGSWHPMTVPLNDRPPSANTRTD
ncbi:MAG: hypothetical protein WD971_04965 [Pirellulales bacterium]